MKATTNIINILVYVDVSVRVVRGKEMKRKCEMERYIRSIRPHVVHLFVRYRVIFHITNLKGN